MTNFRTAKYDEGGLGIDDPNKLKDFDTDGVASLKDTLDSVNRRTDFMSPQLGTIVTDWTSGTIGTSGSTGTVAVLDPEKTCAGSSMLRVTMGAAGTLTLTLTPPAGTVLGQLKTLQVPVLYDRISDDSGSTQMLANPAIWIVGTTGAQARVSLLTTGWRENAMRTWSMAAGGTTNGWSFSGTGPPTDTNFLDGDTIATIRLVFVVNSTDVGRVLWLGPLYNGARSRGVVSIISDGQYTSQRDYILPMLRAQGLRSSLALQNSLVGDSGRMSWTDIYRAYDQGHNVCLHTYDGSKGAGYVDATDWPTAASITADRVAGYEDFKARGLHRGNYYGVWGGSTVPFLYSQGKTRRDLVVNALVAANTKAMRNASVAGGAYNRLQSIAHPDFVDPLYLQGAIQVSNGHTATDLTNIIDAARDRGEWAIIALHRSVISGPGSLEMTNADMDTWISYLGAQARLGAVTVEPMDEVCERLGVTAV